MTAINVSVSEALNAWQDATQFYNQAATIGFMVVFYARLVSV